MKYIWQCIKRNYRWFQKCLFLLCSWCRVCIVYRIDNSSEVSHSRCRKTYVFILCDRKFFSAGALEHRMKLCAVRQKFEICEKIYKNKNMLAFHRLTYGTTDFYLCHYCERFVFSSSLGLHLIGDHRDKFHFLCNSCIKVFLSKLEIIIHRKNHPKAIHIKKKHCLCYFCCDVLDSFIKLQYREKWIHEGTKEQQIPEFKNSSKYIFEVFGLIFKYCALLKNNASVHGRTKEQFQCEVCGVV